MNVIEMRDALNALIERGHEEAKVMVENHDGVYDAKAIWYDQSRGEVFVDAFGL